MALFSVTRTSSALSTTNDTVTITAHATKPLRVLYVEASGMGTASAANEIVIARSSGGTTAGGAITAAPLAGSGSAGFTVATTWVAQPSLSTVLHRLSVNANGGKDRFNPAPGLEIEVPAGGQISIRSASGTSNVTINEITIDEIG
jgi:hypothetical protein